MSIRKPFLKEQALAGWDIPYLISRTIDASFWLQVRNPIPRCTFQFGCDNPFFLNTLPCLLPRSFKFRSLRESFFCDLCLTALRSRFKGCDCVFSRRAAIQIRFIANLLVEFFLSIGQRRLTGSSWNATQLETESIFNWLSTLAPSHGIMSFCTGNTSSTRNLSACDEIRLAYIYARMFVIPFFGRRRQIMSIIRIS